LLQNSGTRDSTSGKQILMNLVSIMIIVIDVAIVHMVTIKVIVIMNLEKT
jgi:hypothetical protein